MSEKLRKLKDKASQAFSDGKWKDALKAYAAIVEEDPTEIACRIKIGDIHRRLGQKKEAVTAYEPVARHYAEDGLLLKAIAVCKLILSVDATHTKTQDMLANLYATRSEPSPRAPRRELTPSTPLKPLSPSSPSSPSSLSSLSSQSAMEIEIDASEESGDLDMVIERTAADAEAAKEAPALQPPSWPPAPAAPVSVIVGSKVEEPKVQVIVGTKVDTPPPAPSQPNLAAWPQPGATPAAVVSQPNLSAWPQPGAKPAQSMDAAPATPPEPAPIDIPIEQPVEALVQSVPAAPAAPGRPQLIVAEEQDTLESLLDAAQAANREGSDSLVSLEEEEFDVAPRYGESRPIELSRSLRKKEPPQPGAGDGDDGLGGLSLPQIPLFSDLPKEAFIEILVQMTMRELSPGEFVIREGEIGEAFYVIASGKVRVARRNPEGGRETVLAYLTDGAFFGEMALLQDGARTASVIVEEESQIFEINRGVLDRVVAQYPGVARVLRNFYTQRLLSTTMATHPLFRPFAAEQRRGLMEKFRSRMFKSGEVLVKEGAKGEGLYLLLTGSLEVSKIRDSQPFVIAELGTGDVFGEMSLLMNRPTIASVQATKDSFVLRLAKKDFDTLIMTHPQILELVAQISDARETENNAIFAGWEGPPEAGAALV